MEFEQLVLNAVLLQEELQVAHGKFMENPNSVFWKDTYKKSLTRLAVAEKAKIDFLK